MAIASIRSTILKQLRVQVIAVPHSITQNPNSSFSISSAVNHRLFRRNFSTSDEVRGSFLDKSEVTDRVLTVVKNFQKVDPSKVTPNAHFQKDLGLDSLDTVEVVMSLEEEFHFEIPDNEADKISSVDMAVDFIASHPQAK
ncbi:hypothetical protein vseg_008505 [Gypsophila vaccaria]